MRTLDVVVSQPFIHIGLQLFNRAVNLAPERHLVKLLQNGFVKSLADSIGLRVMRLSLDVLNVIQGQVELVIVLLRPAAVFCAAIIQHANDA